MPAANGPETVVTIATSALRIWDATPTIPKLYDDRQRSTMLRKDGVTIAKRRRGMNAPAHTIKAPPPATKATDSATSGGYWPCKFSASHTPSVASFSTAPTRLTMDMFSHARYGTARGPAP